MPAAAAAVEGQAGEGQVGEGQAAGEGQVGEGQVGEGQVGEGQAGGDHHRQDVRVRRQQGPQRGQPRVSALCVLPGSM